MINPLFYAKERVVKEFLGGKIGHYQIKESSVALEVEEYTLKAQEDVYTLAAKLFGKDYDDFWTYIADINMLRDLDEWKAGDVILLPKILLRDTEVQPL
jgi:hypothetical protein